MNTLYSEDELTPWYCGVIHPIRNGSYQLRLKGSSDFVEGWFANDRWMLIYRSVSTPLKLPSSDFEWRGLNKERKTEPFSRNEQGYIIIGKTDY